MSTTRPAALHVWLPALEHFPPDAPLRQWLSRADRLPDGAAGYTAGLGEYFEGVGAGLSAAAITRDFVAGDAADHLWLAADPAWVQPDLNGVRLLACGQLQLSIDDARALAEPLLPFFQQAGMHLEISTPDRWHLRLPAQLALPTFSAPEQALGEDLSQHLPQGATGRVWRVLLNDIQVVLHQHPLNAARRARGLPPVNSLWLWGGGRLPDALHSQLVSVISDDLLLRALARLAKVACDVRSPQTIASARAGSLIDLQDLGADEITSRWWPALHPLLASRSAVLHFSSGDRWRRNSWHRWRLWRRGMA